MNILPFFFFLLNIDGWIISESFVEEELALERERGGRRKIPWVGFIGATNQS